MIQLKPNKNGTADVNEFSTKHNGVTNLTKIVLAISVLLAVLMFVSK